MTTEPLIPQRRPIPALLNEVKVAAVRKLFQRLEQEGFEEVREGHGCVFGFIDIENGSRLTELAERAGLTKQAVGEAASELERLGLRGAAARPHRQARQDHQAHSDRRRGVPHGAADLRRDRA
jgi:hypothetical protein